MEIESITPEQLAAEEKLTLEELAEKDKPRLYLTSQELADRWGFSLSAVSTWRKRGQGPEYHKKGYRSVVYMVSDIEKFEKENPGFLL